jgi:hypothetical protein
VWPNKLAHDHGVTLGGIEGLVPAPFSVVHIFANDSPVILNEGGLPKDLVGMAEAVQNEPGFVAASQQSKANAGGGLAYSCVRPSLSEWWVRSVRIDKGMWSQTVIRVANIRQHISTAGNGRLALTKLWPGRHKHPGQSAWCPLGPGHRRKS